VVRVELVATPAAVGLAAGYQWAKRQDGFGSARMNITEEVVHAFDWLGKEVE
jgi:hypothetical protein